MTHACQYGADHSGWNKHIRCTTKPHYALVHSFPCGRHYPYLWWWRSFHCDRLGRHLPSLKKNNNDKKKIYIYIYTWNLYTFRFLIKKAMDEVCTCHTKGKILLLLLREGVTWQVLSNQIPIYIYVYIFCQDSVCTSWPRANYFSVRPSHSVIEAFYHWPLDVENLVST